MDGKKLLKEHAELLLLLENCNPKTRKYIINRADKNLILCISKILTNILRGISELHPDQKKKLVKFSPHFRTLLKKTTGIKKKKKAIQTGGFLPAIIAPIASILASIIGGIIK